MSNTIAAAKGALAAKNLGIGAGVWLLLSAHVPSLGEATQWVEFAGKVVALVVGLVMLFKYKGETKDLLDYMRDILKNNSAKILLVAGLLTASSCAMIRKAVRPQLYIYGNVQVDSICVFGDSCGIFKK